MGVSAVHGAHLVAGRYRFSYPSGLTKAFRSSGGILRWLQWLLGGYVQILDRGVIPPMMGSEVGLCGMPRTPMDVRIGSLELSAIFCMGIRGLK
jgi:hypothetical protein